LAKKEGILLAPFFYLVTICEKSLHLIYPLIALYVIDSFVLSFDGVFCSIRKYPLVVACRGHSLHVPI